MLCKNIYFYIIYVLCKNSVYIYILHSIYYVEKMYIYYVEKKICFVEKNIDTYTM